MSMVVQHNMKAMNANRLLGITTGQQAKSTEKLSSGYKINRAADDAAGLSISEKMRKQIRGLDKASSNAQDGISAVQTAEGALTEVHSMLQRMNELATQASNGTNSETDRQSIQDEIDQLTTEIDRVAETTKFNETYLLKGDKATKDITLNGHDAGVKGTFVDGADTATLTVDLSVGKSVTIAGQTYNIAKYDGKNDNGSENALKSSDSTKTLQDAIKNISTTSSTVTLDGATYTYNGTSKTFDTVNGTSYSADELSGKIKDGSKVAIKDGSTNISEIARDYTDTEKNISAATAKAKITEALTQANNIGTTAGKNASVSGGVATGTVAELSNGYGTAQADVAMVAYNKTTGELKTIASGADITEYASSSDFQLYKALTTVSNGAGKTHDRNVLVTHSEAATNSTKGAYTIKAGDDLTAVGGGITGFTGNTPTITANYNAYEEINIVADSTITNATHEAYADITADNVGTTKASYSVDFEKVKSQEMADGQNALIKALDDGEIAYNITNAGTKGEFSHKFTDTNLDIDKDGKVTYKGTEIATINQNTTAGTLVVGKDTLDLSGAGTAIKKAAAFVEKPDGEVTFTITKGKTTVAEDLTLNLHVGADADMTNKISLGIASMDSKGLGISGINVKDESGVAATYAIDAISDAIAKVSSQRSTLGAVQNRLEHTIANLDNVVENTQSAESQIRDTDMAEEMVNFSKNNILAQAGQSMLAQANQSNQGVLSLLG